MMERDWRVLLWFVLGMWFVVRPLGGYLARQRERERDLPTPPTAPKRKSRVTFTLR